MNKIRSSRRWSLLTWGGLAILLAFITGNTPWINAQIATTTATLSGAVTDPAGAVIPKATITLTSTGKGITRTFTSDDGGRYSFNQLPPAAYSLTVKAKGFETYLQNGIVLNAAETATQNVSLVIGAETTSVTVTADVTLLNTDNANVAADIDAKQIVELPLNVRNVYGLATLNSSVQNSSEGQLLLGGGGNTTDTADQDISFMNFAGGFFGTTAFLVDGSWDTDTEWGAVIFVPGVDAVQEFKIQNNSFTAQYGWSTGNVVNVVTKSGTHDFHGSGYEFYSSNNFNALNYFQSPGSCQGLLNTNLCTFSRNQVGGTGGGPLYIPGIYKQRNKTFIFGNYEHFHANTPSPSQYTVPDTNFLAGNFSEQLSTTSAGNDALGRPIYNGQIYDPRSGHAITAGQPDTYNSVTNPYGTNLVATTTGFIRNPVPGNILSNIAGYTPDPVGAKLLSYFPAAQKPGMVGNNLTLAGQSPTFWDEYGIRVDQNINDNTNAYFRYSYKEEAKTGVAANWGSDPAGQGNQRPNNRWGMWAGLTRIFSPTFTMNITSGLQIWHETSTNQSFGFNPSSTLGLPAYVDQVDPIFPTVNFGGGGLAISQLGPITGNANGTTNHGPIGTVNADFIKTKGKNTINFGFMGVEQIFSQDILFTNQLSFEGTFTAGPTPNVPTTGVSFTGNGVAQALLGVLDSSANTPTNVGTPTIPYESNHLFGEYVQDDWKPVHNLTLNLGIRYEIQTPYTSRGNQGSIFNPNALNPLSYAAGMPLLGALQFLGPDNRYMYDPNYHNIAPRVGFSYQAIPKAVIHGGYGIFYPETLTSSGAYDADGFTATTGFNQSLNGGVTPNPNVSTSNPWGGQYAQITGNVNGSYQQDGNGVGGTFRSRKSPYVQQWLLGVQYAFTPNDQLDVNYIGNRGIRMVSNWNYNQLNPKYLFAANGTPNTSFLTAAATSNPLAVPLQALEKSGTIAPSACNIDNASVTNEQLLTAYPQYCGVSQVDAPLGQSLYNSLQVTYNHRISKGLTALVSYTYSKFIDNVEGNQAWSYNGAANWGATANYFNIAGEKSVDAGDIPQALVASYVYNLPIGRGKAVGGGMNRIADAVIGGWELSGIATLKGGLPLSVFGNNWTSFGGDPRPDYVSGVNPKPAHQTISSTVPNSWANSNAFTYAAYGSFGNTPRYMSELRGPHFTNWDSALEKNWSIRESMRAQFRFETFNSLNHPNFYAPGPGNMSLYSPGIFGEITNSFPGRVVQLAGKFYW